MSAPKKMMSFAAIGAAIAALFKGFRHRDDDSVTPPKEAGPEDTAN